LTTVTDTNAPVIDATNGIITWTPTLADVGSNYLFTTIVTDTNHWAVNSKSLSATNNFYVTVLSGVIGGQPQSNTVPAGGINWLAISVPTNAVAATNILLYATNLPVNVWFSTNAPPTIINPGDVDLIPGSTGGSALLSTNGSPVNSTSAYIVPGGTYYLGVQNQNAFTVNYGIEVDFDTTPARPPVFLSTPTNMTMNEMTTNFVSNPATNFTAGTLSYALINPPLWATINSTNGLITLAPDEAAGSGTNTITTVVTDSGPPATSATNSFQVTVNEVNRPPVFNATPANQTNNELTLIVITNAATDPDLPTNLLAYSVMISVDTNTMTTNGWPLTYATNNPAPVIDTNGVITWTPSEAQGPGVYFITTVVTDTNPPAVNQKSFSVTNNFEITIEEVNQPPVFIYPTNITVITIPATVPFTNNCVATDPDIPANPLTLALVSGPTNMTVTTNGVIAWTPVEAQAGTNTVSISVTDTNIYALTNQSYSVTNTFTIIVLPTLLPGQPQTNTVSPGGINWIAVSVPTNAVAATNILLFATNLPVNVWFSTNQPSTTTNANDVDLMPNATNGVSVLTATSAPTNIVPGGVYFLGVQNTNSLAVTYGLEVDFLLATPTNIVVTNVIRISSIVYTNISGTNGFLLTWFAPSNDFFQVQWTPSLAPQSWSAFTNIVSYNVSAFTSPTNTQFNFFDDGSQTGGFGPMRFYRLILLQATNTLTLPIQTNLIVSVSAPVTVTNTAVDSWTNAVLTYSLVDAPANASISANGVIAWTNATPAGVARRFTTIVKDNGLPPASATNTFTIFVAPTPSITNVTVTDTNTVLSWLAPTNDQFQVQWATNLAPVINWFTFPDILTSTDGTFTFMDTNAPLVIKFYRLVFLP
jgi:hypothetical protein